MTAGVLCAAASGDVAAVLAFMDLGGDVNANHHGVTLLMAASIGGHLGVVKVLLERGASPDLAPSGSAGRTALMGACVALWPETVGLLVEAGASIQAVNRAGKRAIDELGEASRQRIMTAEEFVRFMSCTRLLMENFAVQEMSKMVPQPKLSLSEEDDMKLAEWMRRVRSRHQTMEDLMHENARRGIDHEANFATLANDASGRSAFDFVDKAAGIWKRRLGGR